MNDVKKYTFVDWTQMTPGAIIGGFIRTPGGLGMGSGWANELSSTKSWRRICFSEHFLKIKDKIPVAKISRCGVSIYYTNIKEFNEILKDAKIDFGRKVFTSIDFEINQPLGLFLGSILRINGETYVNLLSLEGYDVWLLDQSY